jgi:anti-anti-sigma regulatory factor
VTREAYDRGARYFLLDLDHVPSLTSAGLKSIHWIYKMASQDLPPSGGEAAIGGSARRAFKSPHIKVFTTSPHVLKVLRIAGFDMYIDIHQDLQEAIAAF